MAELKPFPFCGGTPTVDDCGEHRYFIRCKCGIVQDKLYMQKCDAIRRWNKRKIAKDTNVPSTDCISRQQAIDVLDVLCQEHRYKIPGKRETYSQYNEAWQDALDRAEGAIFNLPTAQLQRMKGRWIYGENEYGIDGYHCDKCGFFVPWDYVHKFINYIEDYKFCPSCGAQMDGGEQDG